MVDETRAQVHRTIQVRMLLPIHGGVQLTQDASRIVVLIDTLWEQRSEVVLLL